MTHTLTPKAKSITIGLIILTILFGALYLMFEEIDRQLKPDLSYSLKSVDCSQAAKDSRNKTPRGEYYSTSISDACVITITVANNEFGYASVDYMAIGGGPAGTVFNKPPVQIYSGNNFCYGLPTKFGFEPRSQTDVWIECLGSNNDGDRDQSADQRPTKIVISGLRKTVLDIK